MIDVLRQKISDISSNQEKYNFLREYFQLLILRILDEQGYFQYIAFMGGTALRVLYDIERFSEALDFNLIKQNNFNIHTMMTKLKQEFALMDLDVTMNVKDRNNVAIAQIRFNNVLYELGLSSLKNQKIMVKFEVDKNPPADFNVEFTLVNKEFLINLLHLDKPSLFSGKLHALFCRKYIKGRDYYDLMWFLTKKITPNFEYLNAGLQQQNKKARYHTIDALKQALSDIIQKTDFDQVLEDVRPFLQDEKQVRFFTQAAFEIMLKNWHPENFQ